jgi:hypothetical protein
MIAIDATYVTSRHADVQRLAPDYGQPTLLGHTSPI